MTTQADAHSATIPVTTGTLGVDLAAQQRKTAGCMIEWDERGNGLVHCPTHSYADYDLFGKLLDVEYVTHAAIDVPFGWPEAFLATITAYQRSGTWPVPYYSDAVVLSLRLRATDRAIAEHERVKLAPLSVSTDRIGIVAMHCARLLAAVGERLGEPVDRAGTGRILEVYPAAALRNWGISLTTSENPGTYKGTSAPARVRREWLMSEIVRQTSGWLEIGEKAELVCIDNDDCLDALICALVARAADCRLLEAIDDPAGLASTEGWIRLPQADSLGRLGGRPQRP